MIYDCPIREGAQLHPDAEALRFAGQIWTFRALDEEVTRWTQALAARGLDQGDRVALLSTSRPSVTFLFWALGRLGAIFAPLNARLTPAELQPLMEDVEPRLTLVLGALRDRLPDAEVLESFPDGVTTHAVPARTWDADTSRVILFTSGTTGRPKGAVLTEGAFRASCRSSAANLGAHPAPRWLGTLPLFHVGGLAMLTRTAYEGGCLLLHERFDADAVNRAIDTEGASHASFVATTLERVLDARQDRTLPATFRCALIGGGPVPTALLTRARAAGLLALQTYGLTEACSQVTTERPGEADGRTAGPPLPGLEVRIVGTEGETLGEGQEGDVEVRGPTLMARYWRQRDATRDAFHDGWLRTRDVGVLDSKGRLTLLSRRTDLIVRGGENLYPAEVEAVLANHPAILESAVVGVPEPHWGEVPVAFVVLRPGHALPEDLDAWCRQSLARFKVPTRFVAVETLPRNAMSKVERSVLRKQARSHPPYQPGS
ncbi:o-succinylbenzoate--CoA ligase [Corallococcus exiguus]|uniref:o-succinylbenzoate--CoA ligase n=1 Tax=Corallococcus TaxID=83461 RepID=UPI000EEE2513|nr:MULTISPECIES: o-succinylbenzoate--CoA ligase [Corallococcus]NNC01705.1 o-succinylbenzoate--CoA ligase [Corallococcus exiguus]NPC48478.1 o-succinylbenzoate--CoA ligase [Corallococcus exiguus]RKH84478.1 o-succinylbenzoate--CoA ligase [Corallococcus sp. AB032C]